jgi:hypothetical protein
VGFASLKNISSLNYASFLELSEELESLSGTESWANGIDAVDSFENKTFNTLF